VSAGHFTTHLDEVIAYNGDGSYTAKRLVLYPIGATGYAHATLLMMPAGTKVLSHWHDDREAVFLGLAGRGRFLLDGVERAAVAGTAMLQTRGAVHGFKAEGEERFDFLDVALLTDRGDHADAAGCFCEVGEVVDAETAYGSARALFAGRFANPAIRFVGERTVAPGAGYGAETTPRGCEQIQLVTRGRGEVRLLGRTVELRAGSVLYAVDGLDFELRAGDEGLGLVAAVSAMGRIPVPPWFAGLRSAA